MCFSFLLLCPPAVARAFSMPRSATCVDGLRACVWQSAMHMCQTPPVSEFHISKTAKNTYHVNGLIVYVSAAYNSHIPTVQVLPCQSLMASCLMPNARGASWSRDM